MMKYNPRVSNGIAWFRPSKFLSLLEKKNQGKPPKIPRILTPFPNPREPWKTGRISLKIIIKKNTKESPWSGSGVDLALPSTSTKIGEFSGRQCCTRFFGGYFQILYGLPNLWFACGSPFTKTTDIMKTTKTIEITQTATKKELDWEVLNGVGWCRWGRSDFPFSTHFSPFSTHFSPFSPKGQGQTTAIYCKNGGISLWPRLHRPRAKTSRLNAGLAEITDTTKMTKTMGTGGANHGLPKNNEFRKTWTLEPNWQGDHLESLLRGITVTLSAVLDVFCESASRALVIVL